MKITFKTLACLAASFTIAIGVCAEKTELYALDGRTLFVDEAQIEAYTAPGMGWYLEKPVTMHAADGRTLVVAADQVEAYKAVGWFLDEQSNEAASENDNVAETPDKEEDIKVEDTASSAKETIRIKYTDGTVISVPSEHLKMYLALDWNVVGSESDSNDKVIMYNADGVSKEVSKDEVSKYELAGWSEKKPDVEYMTVFSHNGETKEIAKESYENYKSQGWYSAYDEAVYAYAAFGNGGDVPGVSKMIENKQYELAFNTVKEAIDKIESSESEYVSMLYYLRSMVTDAWREAANSPLGFINYWFTDKNDNRYVIFEYRNVSNSRIKYFEINFDICDKDGNVIETNSGSYYVDNLQLVPCDKTRVGWSVKSGKDAVNVKNVKVKEVRFADGTKWNAAQ